MGVKLHLFLETLKYMFKTRRKSLSRSNTSTEGAGRVVFVPANEHKRGELRAGQPSRGARKGSAGRFCHRRKSARRPEAGGNL